MRCPSCVDASLRQHAGRLACDRCGGLMLAFASRSGGAAAEDRLAFDHVERAILERAGARPDIELVGERAGRRSCPRCSQPMTTLQVRVSVLGRSITPGPELDRCADHGVWFDGSELAEVLDKVRSTSSGGDEGGSGGDPGGTGIGPGWV